MADRALVLGTSELSGQVFQIPAARSGTKKFGVVGTSGSGKTHNSAVLVEQYVKCGIATVILDPVGRWYDLGIAANGIDKGLPIALIGGTKGQIALTPEMGPAIARYVSLYRVPTVVDMSQMRSKSHWRQLIAEFGNELFEINERPLHLVIEEAPEFVPQKVFESVAGVYGVMDQIIRIGRNKGIGISLIGQRPQQINKDSLSQVNVLLVMRLTDPTGIDTIKDWLTKQGADSDLTAEFLRRLPSLDDGVGLVLSPAWLKTFDIVRFNRRETYHLDPEADVGPQFSPDDIARAVDTTQLEKVFAEFTRPKALLTRTAKVDAALTQRVERLQKENEALHTALDSAQANVMSEEEVEQRIRLAVQDRQARIIRLEAFAKSVGDQALSFFDESQAVASTAILQAGVAAPQKVAAYVADQSEFLKNDATKNKKLRIKMLVAILETLRDNYLSFPGGMTRHEIATLAHYDPTGGPFGYGLAYLLRRRVLVQDGNRYLLNPIHLK